MTFFHHFFLKFEKENRRQFCTIEHNKWILHVCCVRSIFQNDAVTSRCIWVYYLNFHHTLKVIHTFLFLFLNNIYILACRMSHLASSMYSIVIETITGNVNCVYNMEMCARNIDAILA